MGEGRPGTFEFRFLGAFRLTAPDGRRIHIRSRKGIALLAMLATADRGERTRNWLQEKLWGSRGLQQAQYSLRRELSSLRVLLKEGGIDLLEADLRSIRLNLSQISIDIRDHRTAGGGEFLEGIDIPGEDAFEDWLRDMRTSLVHRTKQLLQPPPVDHLTAEIAPRRNLVLALAVMPVSIPADADVKWSMLGSEIVHGLTKFIAARKWLPVVAPASNEVTAEREHSDPTTQSTRYELGLELLIGPSARLVLMLKERQGGRLLWTETLQIADPLDLDQFGDGLGRLSSVMTTQVFYAEWRRIQSLREDEYGPAELTHLVQHHLSQISRTAVRLARAYLNRALEMGPRTAEHAILGAYIDIQEVMGSDHPDHSVEPLRAWAANAINADPTDWRGRLLASLVELWFGHAELAIVHAIAAKKLCPYNAAIIGHLGAAYLWSGQAEVALAELDTALSLSPLDRSPYLTLCNLALAHLIQGRLGQALLFGEQAASCAPDLAYAYLLQIEILVALSRTVDAGRIYKEVFQGKIEDPVELIRRVRLIPLFRLPMMTQALAAAIEAAERMDECSTVDELSTS